MAPKRFKEDPPPAADSSGEEEESENVPSEEQNDGSEGEEVEEVEKSEDGEDEEDDEAEDEEQDKKPSESKATVTTSTKVSKPQLSSDSGEESGSESDSESDRTQPSPSASDFTIKPIMSKPMDDSLKPKKNAGKRNLTPAANAGSKRSSESDIEGKESKKKKKILNGEDDDVKKGSGFQRLWSEEDEIVILRGMVEYQTKKGSDPYADMGAFHEFIKKNLHVDVSKNQLMDKIRRLKKKYLINAEKGENGEDPVFSKPHEQKSFELSKKIWASGAINGVEDNGKSKRKSSSKVKRPLSLASPKKEVVPKKKEEPNDELNAEPEFSSNYPFLDGILVSGKLSSLPETATSYMREALPLLESVKAKELDRKWHKLQEDEMQLYLKKIELVHESAKLLLEAKKSSNS
ncbi:mediator-associated protein 1-like [Quillaja saponaria]|uniref:Mediator-associated protein 1-like n=1 Tax=Quillaja saponaria TaxID=32244 RepID=A0AAD7QGY7_QUISA|nr:mediator-associated protein 1-like [Quillaja saponaria]KAJ7981342.1 mediator-associated protein 1-like [Quillaja saponaria]